MAQQFNLTAQLQLQAPTNTNQVINQIRKQLKPIGVQVKIQNARNLSQANSALSSLNKNAQASKRSVNDLNRTLQESARRFSVITLATGSLLALANGFKNAVRGAVDFERELIKISQVTGRTTAGLQGLTQEITRLSTSLGASSSDLLGVAKILSQAGFAAADTRRALDILAKTTLGSTFDNIQQTTEGAIALLRQFSVEAQRSGGNIAFLEKSLDAINSVSKSFAVESGDLITAIRRVGGVFSAAGGSVNELIALFTSVRATTRESAETIATGLRTIFTRIQRTETIDQLKRLNIELSDSSGNFVGAYKAVERLSQGLAGLDPRSGTFSQIVEELGGFRQVGKVIPLIQQFATAQNALNVAQSASGSVSRDAIKAQQGLGVQIAKVREQFDALIRKFSDTATFNTIATGALRLAEAFIKIADSMERLLPLIAAFTFAKLGKGLAPAVGGVLGIGRRAASGGSVSRFASGGLVPGSGNSDTVPAMLTPGEFVIKKSSVNKLGAGTLAAMNQNRYADGGIASLGNKPAKTRFINNKKEIVGMAKDTYYMPNSTDRGVEISRQSYQQLRGGGRGWEEWLNKESKKNQGRPRGLPKGRLKLNRQSGYPVDFTSDSGRIYDAKDLREGSISNIEKAKKSLNYAFIKALGGGWKWSGRPSSSPIRYGGQSFGTSNKKLSPNTDQINLQPLTLLYPKIVNKEGKALNLKKEQATRTQRNKNNQEKPMATGGGISGSDTVPALLTPGEFVFSKSSAQSIGYSNLNRMNKHGVRGYASGGIVQGFNEGGRASAGGTLQGIQGVAQASQSMIFLAGAVSTVATQFLELEDAQSKTVTEVIGRYTVLTAALGTFVDILTSTLLLFQLNKKSENEETIANKAAAASEYDKIRANKAGVASSGASAAGSVTGSAAGSAAGTGLFARLGNFFKSITKVRLGLLGLATTILTVAGTFIYFDYLKTQLKNLADAAKSAADAQNQEFESGKSTTSGRSSAIQQAESIVDLQAKSAESTISYMRQGIIGVLSTAGTLGGAALAGGATFGAGSVAGGIGGGAAGYAAGSKLADYLFGEKEQQILRQRDQALARQITVLNNLYDSYESVISASNSLKEQFSNFASQGLQGGALASARISAVGESGLTTLARQQAQNSSLILQQFLASSNLSDRAFGLDDLEAGKIVSEGGFTELDQQGFQKAQQNLQQALEQLSFAVNETLQTLDIAQKDAFAQGQTISGQRIRELFSGIAKPTTEYERALVQAKIAQVEEYKAKKANLQLELLDAKIKQENLKAKVDEGTATKTEISQLEIYNGLISNLNSQISALSPGIAQLANNTETANKVVIAENRSRIAALRAQQQYAAKVMQTARVMQSFQEEIQDLDLQGQLFDNLKTARSGGLVRGNVVKLTESDISKIANPARFASELARILAGAQDARVTSAGREALRVVEILQNAQKVLVGKEFTGTNNKIDAKNLLIQLGIDKLISPDQLEALVNEIVNVAADGLDPQEFSQLFAKLFEGAQQQVDGVVKAATEKSEKFLDNYNKYLDNLIEKQDREVKARERFVDALDQFDDIRNRVTQQLARDRGVDIAPDIGRSRFIREQAEARANLRTRGLDPNFAGNVQALGAARRFLESRRDDLTAKLNQQRTQEEQRKTAEELAKTQMRLEGVNKELERLRTSTTGIDMLFNAMDRNSQLIDKERSKRETLLGVLEEAVTGGAEGRQNLYRNQAMATRAIQTGTLQGFAPEDQKQIVTFLRSLGDEIPVAFGKSGKQLADELIARDVFRDPFINPAFKQALASTITSEEKLIQANLSLAEKIDKLADIMVAANNPAIAGGFSKGGAVYRATGGAIGSIFKPKGTDTIPAMLSEGEYVLRKSAVDKYGTQTLDNMNKGKGFVSGPGMTKGGGGSSLSQYFNEGSEGPVTLKDLPPDLRDFFSKKGISGAKLLDNYLRALNDENAQIYSAADTTTQVQNVAGYAVPVIGNLLNSVLFSARSLTEGDPAGDKMYGAIEQFAFGILGRTIGKATGAKAMGDTLTAGQSLNRGLLAGELLQKRFMEALAEGNRGTLQELTWGETKQATSQAIMGLMSKFSGGAQSLQQTMKPLQTQLAVKFAKSDIDAGAIKMIDDFVNVVNQRTTTAPLVGRSKNTGGIYEASKRSITISPTSRDPAAALMHEKLHSVSHLTSLLEDAGHKITPDVLGMISKKMGVPIQGVRTMVKSGLFSTKNPIGGAFTPFIRKDSPELIASKFLEEFNVAQGLIASGSSAPLGSIKLHGEKLAPAMLKLSKNDPRKFLQLQKLMQAQTSVKFQPKHFEKGGAFYRLMDGSLMDSRDGVRFLHRPSIDDALVSLQGLSKPEAIARGLSGANTSQEVVAYLKALGPEAGGAASLVESGNLTKDGILKSLGSAGRSVAETFNSPLKDLGAAGAYGAKQLKAESVDMLKPFKIPLKGGNPSKMLAVMELLTYRGLDQFNKSKGAIGGGVLSSVMKPILDSVSEIAIAGFMNDDGTLNQERYNEYMEGKQASNMLNLVSQNPKVAARVNELREFVRKNPGVMSREGKQLTQLGQKEVVTRMTKTGGIFRYIEQGGSADQFGAGIFGTGIGATTEAAFLGVFENILGSDTQIIGTDYATTRAKDLDLSNIQNDNQVRKIQKMPLFRQFMSMFGVNSSDSNTSGYSVSAAEDASISDRLLDLVISEAINNAAMEANKKQMELQAQAIPAASAAEEQRNAQAKSISDRKALDAKDWTKEELLSPEKTDASTAFQRFKTYSKLGATKQKASGGYKSGIGDRFSYRNKNLYIQDYEISKKPLFDVIARVPKKSPNITDEKIFELLNTYKDKDGPTYKEALRGLSEFTINDKIGKDIADLYLDPARNIPTSGFQSAAFDALSYWAGAGDSEPRKRINKLFSGSYAYQRWGSSWPRSVFNGLSTNDAGGGLMHFISYYGDKVSLESNNLPSKARDFAAFLYNKMGKGSIPESDKYPKYFAHGGKVPLYLNKGGAGDNVPAMLTAGEYVMNKQAVSKYGIDTMDRMNKGQISAFSRGGSVGSGVRYYAKGDFVEGPDGLIYRQAVDDDERLKDRHVYHFGKYMRAGRPDMAVRYALNSGLYVGGVTRDVFERYFKDRNQAVPAVAPFDLGGPQGGGAQGGGGGQGGGGNGAANPAIVQLNQTVTDLKTTVQTLSTNVQTLATSFGPNGAAVMEFQKFANATDVLRQTVDKLVQPTANLSTGLRQLSTAIKDGLSIELEVAPIEIKGNLTLEGNVIDGLSRGVGEFLMREDGPLFKAIDAEVSRRFDQGAG